VVDDGLLWEIVGDRLGAEPVWRETSDAVGCYLAEKKVGPILFMGDDPEYLYMKPLVSRYVARYSTLAFSQSNAQSEIDRMKRELSLPSLPLVGSLYLERFGAAHPFRLQGHVVFRPITGEELFELGCRCEQAGGHMGSALCPREDAWICQATLNDGRGTSGGMGRMQALLGDNVPAALRMFKNGDVSVTSTGWRWDCHYGTMAFGLGGHSFGLAHGQPEYSLSAGEIVRLQRFWAKFRPIAEAPNHYLQAPLRRLRTAGTRTAGMDAIVDYVIALEALLTSKSESQSELGYRFRLRGALLCAGKREDRRDWLDKLRTLYELRSSIVHGRVIEDDDLREALPIAEKALRTIWRWYFAGFSDKQDNGDGVQKIDRLLLS